jgi:hypothetical protein
MQDLLESIKAAIGQGATPSQKTAAAQACRTLLTALEAEAGKAIPVPGAPTPHPLSQIDPTQALDLLIARLRSALPADQTPAPATGGVRFSLVKPRMR